MAKKSKAIMRLSKEAMHYVLMVPENVEVESINFDYERGIYNIVIQSDTPQKGLFTIAECQQIPEDNFILSNIIKYVEHIKKLKEFLKSNKQGNLLGLLEVLNEINNNL